MSARRSKHRFQLVLIRPSHYDNEGNLVQSGRLSIPASSLACLYALALDAAERQVLGPEVAIDITAIDETNTRVRTQEIIVQLARHEGFGMVGLIGVQPKQFARSLDIARPLRAAGISVVISGSPVTGPLAMLPGAQNDLKQALDMGCSLFDGDAENGRGDSRCRERLASIPLRSRARPVGARICPVSVHAAGSGEAPDRSLRKLRRGSRLSIPMLLLHEGYCGRT
jgi:hypothetical protein